MGRHTNHPRWASEQSRATLDRKRRTAIVATAAACVIAIALAIAGSVMAIRGAHPQPQTTGRPSHTSAVASGNAELKRTPVPKADETKARLAARQQSMTALQSQIAEQTAGYQGSWQVYVEDLESGAKAVVNSHQSYSASVIKLMVMLAVFQNVSEGTLHEDASLDGLLEQMITVSSNEATNALVERLGSGNVNAGFDRVNAVAAQYGFSSSHLNSRMGDLSDYSTKQTSVEDQGRFLAAAYRGQLVSPDYSRRMTDIMSRQTRRAKIPGGLPSGVACANKTGEAPGVENDSAIVYGEHPYVIAVMSSDVPDSSTAQSQIRDISATVWACLQ